jgi:PAS domain S-box-containing protein
VSEFAEFAEALRRRREQAERTAPQLLRAVGDGLPREHVGSLVHTSRLMADTMVDLAAAEDELRAQNEELFSARLALEAREAWFRQLFDLAPAPYLVTTRDATIRLVNTAACTLLRRAPNALAGKPLACFVDYAERGAFRTALNRAGSSSSVEEWPIRLVPTDAPAIECRVRVRMLAQSGAGEQQLAWCVTEEQRSALEGW